MAKKQPVRPVMKARAETQKGPSRTVPRAPAARHKVSLFKDPSPLTVEALMRLDIAAQEHEARTKQLPETKSLNVNDISPLTEGLVQELGFDRSSSNETGAGDETQETPPDESLSIDHDFAQLKIILQRLKCRPATAARIVEAVEHELRVAKENEGRATWNPPAGAADPFRHLRYLNAPLFIKEVYEDKIKKGKISSDDIGDYDEAALRAFYVYCSVRKSRGLDRGDAEGLEIVPGKRSRKGPKQKLAL